jgi:NAD-dependent SIR2 family protein deacetylase
MVIDSGNLLFFFGAGASAEFGIPTMRKMAKDFKNELDKENSEEEVVYKEIVEMLNDDMGPDVDIEAIFSVIDGLQEYNIENIGELAIYASKKFFGNSLLNKRIYDKIVLKKLERDFQRFVRKSCALKSDYRDKMVTVYKSFFNSIGKATDAPTSSYDVKYDNRWTLFTTNYDRCLEAFWRENVLIKLDTGFRDKNGSINNNGTLYPDYFLYSFGSELPFLKNGIGYLRLVKLHGSTTWLKRTDIKEIEEKNFDIDQGVDTLGTGKMYDDEVVIYPLRQKQLYVDPYIQMFHCLNKELKSQKVWIVIGYSFRDPVIQNIFNINFKDGKKMILISPHPDDVKERFSDHRGDIIAIEKYFGKDDSQNIINESIQEELGKLGP